MKKRMGAITAVLVIALLCVSVVFTASAKELEPCRLCGGKGDYHCVSCGNTGTVTCRGCNGTGVWNCPGEDGKGKCQNGYYTCPSCHGDTYSRSGDGEIPPDAKPGTCGHCGGKGKLECWTCHGNPTRACDGCNGTGKEECQVGTCKVSRQYGWKCPDCKGTGFILVGNPMPSKESNDGVRNVPAKGDYIVTNDKTWAGYTYGGKTESDKSAGESGDGAASSADEKRNDGEPEQRSETPSADRSLLPENRNSDFDIPIPGENPASSVKPANAVRVEVGSMTEEQQRYFAGLPDEELARILTDIQTIVGTAQPGRSVSKTDELLNRVAEFNGYATLSDGRLFPLYFEGHREIGFPVRVTVGLEKGVLDGGTDLYVYHIAENGDIALSSKAEYGTYEDGSVASISFYTSSFSTFFTAAKELDLAIPSGEERGDVAIGNKIPRFYVAFIAIAVVVISVVTIILIKKRKAKAPRVEDESAE